MKDLKFIVELKNVKDKYANWEQIRDSLEDVLQVDLIKRSIPGKSIKIYAIDQEQKDRDKAAGHREVDCGNPLHCMWHGPPDGW